MAVTPTWDLFIGIFTLVVIAYSFIVGINGTLKVLLSTYLSIFMVEGIYSFVLNLISKDTLISNLNFFDGSSGIVLLKVGLFITCVVLLTTKGRFEPDFQSERFYSFEFAFVPIFGFFCSSILVGTILLYANDGSIFSGLNVFNGESIISIKNSSVFIKYITDYFTLLFAIPGMVLLGLSFLEND